MNWDVPAEGQAGPAAFDAPITREMIRAGAAAILDGDGTLLAGPSLAEHIVSDVLRAALGEVAVTEGMIQAGAEVVWARFFEATAYGSSEGREVAAEVFSAMFAQMLNSDRRPAQGYPAASALL